MTEGRTRLAAASYGKSGRVENSKAVQNIQYFAIAIIIDIAQRDDGMHANGTERGHSQK